MSVARLDRDNKHRVLADRSRDAPNRRGLPGAESFKRRGKGGFGQHAGGDRLRPEIGHSR